MKTLYLECNMGAAGDMLTAALLEIHPNPRDFIERLNALQIPGVHMEREDSEKCGIRGTHMVITVGGEEEESCDVYEHCGEVHGHIHEHGGEVHGEHGHIHEHIYGHDGEVHGEHGHIHEHGGEMHGEHGHMHVHDGEMHGAYGHMHEHHDHMHTHTHSSMEDITELIMRLELEDSVKQDAIAVYRLIAEAESHVHGKPVEQIHFHEVGTMDAVADVISVCMLIQELKPERIAASPVHVGSGHVRCAHGILPVPAPATAYILRGIPIYGGQVRGELCTPTGAALLKYFVKEFGNMPVMRMEKIGYGMGKKDFEMANCVRAMWGESCIFSGFPDRIKEKNYRKE